MKLNDVIERAEEKLLNLVPARHRKEFELQTDNLQYSYFVLLHCSQRLANAIDGFSANLTYGLNESSLTNIYFTRFVPTRDGKTPLQQVSAALDAAVAEVLAEAKAAELASATAIATGVDLEAARQNGDDELKIHSVS